MANAIVASMLPDGVIKGGTALKMRFGNENTRFTTDLDTATATDPVIYTEKLDKALKSGWEGFTGRIIRKEPASPEGIPSDYVMKPYDIKLNYMGKPWCTVPLEVGHNEIGDADIADWVDFTDAIELFINVGLPSPTQVPLMPIVHQIAQKLHAVSASADRARDLIDLQLIERNYNIDFQETRRTCIRLFTYRQAQTWPPTIIKQTGWDKLYTAQASTLPVLPSIDEAITWANRFIKKIDSSLEK
ncbi:nucleotidyl transferase AbiEii/AbiGii toxin family protein [Arcanobacterium hippocoleae]